MRDDEATRGQAADDRAEWAPDGAAARRPGPDGREETTPRDREERIPRDREQTTPSDRGKTMTGDRKQTTPREREETMTGDQGQTAPDGWERAGPADYAAGAADEVTLPPADERREAHDRDIDDPADATVDPAVLRDGGPTRNRGVATTTGGRRGGPASTRRRPRQPGGKVAPTNTGDATTGKFGTPAGGATSDQSSQANQVGNFTDR